MARLLISAAGPGDQTARVSSEGADKTRLVLFVVLRKGPFMQRLNFVHLKEPDDGKYWQLS